MTSAIQEKELLDLIKNFQKEIIDRKWAEKKANDALDYAESIIDSVASPIIVIDNDYKIISVNMEFYHLFNLPVDQSIGRYFFEISENLFNIPALKDIILSNEKSINEFELSHDFKILGKKFLQIKCVNLQYNIKHLSFKLIVINDITDLKNTLNDLKEKHLLLKEIHHRTKNNLLMIEGLFRLQLESIDDEKIKLFLTDNISRVSAITNVHTLLSESGTFDNIDIAQLFGKLVDNLKILYGKKVDFNLAFDNILINFDQGIYLGIISNEIITNSFKHAFNKETLDPVINISLSKLDEQGKYLFKISDNGMNENVDLDLDKTLGFKLVANLITTKLNGTYKIDFKKGLHYEIEFSTN